MARIRSIKPEFAHSESMGKVSRDARLLFVLMWTIADDEGRLRGCSRMLASLLFPYDDDAPKLLDGWVAELERERCVVRYQADGSTFIEICKWAAHQRIDHASRSRIPSFASVREPSRGFASDSERSLPILSHPLPSRESTPGDKAKVAAKPDDVTAEVWQEWLAFRKAKKAPATELVIRQTRKTAEVAGMTMDEALTHWVAQGYQGFFPPNKDKGKFAKPAEPTRNFLPDAFKPVIVMHDGDNLDCQCETCCRNRRNASLGLVNNLSKRVNA